ncbi:hypothetical protein [Pseudomonas fluorescens]|uniref:Uncharacterized protein n=1 Tax=Pseudomonas fluorescens TaxID=294 RepID=A0A944HI70_PSEFL|nr:hypothetical protein [Pseudomonas fluorescens]MBT2294531.1 hypothetical protein [Pseudomonas fluorescens]MBT2306813.1 hypothetical protein [Pseudomonas fluorescens]MBT2316277.1 hypothetical protein [Pseudomonas fluorescens]MBT2331614.1 hypothetical protein [Pseudomonas fluorescens]MBT2342782.1 hypothetical protein [Pseudomonas fluorescens]
MNTRILVLTGLSLLHLTGCGKESPPSVFTVTSNDELVVNTLPAIRDACPGLDKYAQSFENVRVGGHFRTAILFDVPESITIPATYQAGGHTCYIEIDSDGKTIYIEKLACKSICLDQLDTPDGQLKIGLAQENR